ncbi:trypsin-like peptidase domain-containing protein [Patescibacteria group bacterium]|nr:trypsin-like peptidase domain-containing protein [Patescibacteria group bacterium]
MKTKQDFRGLFAMLVIVSLIVGAFGGACGSFFIKPYLERSSWGQKFLENDLTQQITGQKKVYEVSEESSTIDVVKKVSPSVVSILVTKEVNNVFNMTGPDAFDFFGNDFQQPSADGEKQAIGGGSGFVVGSDGLIVTNRHVVADPDAEYSVVFNDGKKFEAKVLGRDAVYDLAILKIDANDLPVIDIGDSDKIEIGQTAIAIGNALDEYRNTVTRGVISGINRRIIAGDGRGFSEVIEEALQTDAAINPGNSGGPLLNIAGQVIGINTAVNNGGQSLGFAIPINQAKNVIESVKTFGRIVRPWLGVRYAGINEELARSENLKYEYGALIVRGDGDDSVAIVPGSPAEKAGIEENDIILEINGEKIDHEHSLVGFIAKFKPGDEITLKIFHKDAEKTLKVKLAEREDNQ